MKDYGGRFDTIGTFLVLPISSVILVNIQQIIKSALVFW